MPDRLVLGRDETARVDVEIEDSSGSPVGGARVEILARRGRVSEVREIGNGRYEAVYHPPPERFPQLEILVVRSSGGGLGWLVLPLIGTGQLEVETEPGAAVRLLVDDVEFGPVSADESGQAVVSFQARPGVRTGTLLTGDPEASASRREVDLGVPLVQPVMMTAGAADLVADGVSSTELEVFLVGGDNRPLSGARLVLTAGAGTVSQPQERETGRYTATYTAPGKAGAGAVNISVEAEGMGAGYRASQIINLRPGAPPEMPFYRRRAFYQWTALGAGIAAVVPGALLVGMDGKETCDASPPVRCPEVYDTLLAGSILLGAGSALLVTALVLYLTGDDQPPAGAAVHLAPGPSGVSIIGSFSF